MRVCHRLKESLNLEKVSLLGHHTGACIVAELAVIRPDLVDKVILNGPPLLSLDERNEMMEMIKKSPPIIPKEDGSHLLDLWKKRMGFFSRVDRSRCNAKRDHSNASRGT
ncbi:MAG: hypothetical protein Ct9H300mP6_06510 [Gammaproteobacteria bacterium]|nr:MAG: hypothetical protein Ct9H300mP6_06510 [Gammaproteobacteria bacterium]